MRSLLIVVMLVAAPAVARAEGPGEVEAPVVKAPVWMWSFGGLMRITRHDADAEERLAVLDEYGYETDTPTLTGLRGDLSWQRAPIVDVGVAWAWAQGGYATGPLYDDPDRLDGSTLEFGVFGRMHWVRPEFPVAPEPRVELGIARTTAELRGLSLEKTGTYLKLGVDLRMGGRKGGLTLSIDYTRVSDPAMNLPVGGLSAALSFYWRDWQVVPPAAASR